MSKHDKTEQPKNKKTAKAERAETATKKFYTPKPPGPATTPKKVWNADQTKPEVTRGTQRAVRRLLLKGLSVENIQARFYVNEATVARAQARNEVVLEKGFLESDGPQAKFERVAYARHHGIKLPEEIEAEVAAEAKRQKAINEGARRAQMAACLSEEKRRVVDQIVAIDAWNQHCKEVA